MRRVAVLRGVVEIEGYGGVALMTKGIEKLKGAKAGDKVLMWVELHDDIQHDSIFSIYGNIILEIVEHEPKPEPVVGYVNVYKNTLGYYVCESKESLEEHATKNRLARLKITYDPATGQATAEVV